VSTGTGDEDCSRSTRNTGGDGPVVNVIDEQRIWVKRGEGGTVPSRNLRGEKRKRRRQLERLRT